MAYDTTELFMVGAVGAAAGQSWRYEGTDTPAAVAAATFISDAADRGMKVGDSVEVIQFSSSAKTAVTQRACFVATAVASTGATLQSEVPVTGTASGGAVTVNGMVGVITTEALSTAAAAEYTCTVTNSQIAAGDIVLASVDAAASAGTPAIGGCTVSAGEVIITVTNVHASVAFDAAITINFKVIKI